MRGVLAVLLGALLFGCGLTAQQKATSRPIFADYAVREMLPDTAARAPLQLRTSFERAFRTRIRMAAKEKPNFAGKYHMAIWGCGSGCATGALIDLAAGVTYRLPFDFEAGLREPGWFEDCNMVGPEIDFHLNSRLLVVRCSGRWDKVRNTAIVDTHYMVWTGSRFDPLVRIEDDRAGPL